MRRRQRDSVAGYSELSCCVCLWGQIDQKQMTLAEHGQSVEQKNIGKKQESKINGEFLN